MLWIGTGFSRWGMVFQPSRFDARVFPQPLWPVREWPVFSKAFDKLWDRLPAWGKAIWVVVVIAACVWGIRAYGLFQFLLRVIFSP